MIDTGPNRQAFCRQGNVLVVTTMTPINPWQRQLDCRLHPNLHTKNLADRLAIDNSWLSSSSSSPWLPFSSSLLRNRPIHHNGNQIPDCTHIFTHRMRLTAQWSTLVVSQHHHRELCQFNVKQICSLTITLQATLNVTIVNSVNWHNTILLYQASQGLPHCRGSCGLASCGIRNTCCLFPVNKLNNKFTK